MNEILRALLLAVVTGLIGFGALVATAGFVFYEVARCYPQR